MTAADSRRPMEPPAPPPPRMELYDQSRTDWWVCLGVFIALLFAGVVGVAIEISRPAKVMRSTSRFVAVEHVDGHEFIVHKNGGIVHHPDCLRCKDKEPVSGK